MLTVGPCSLGTTEEGWASSRQLADVAPFNPPDCARVVVVAPHPDDEVLGAGGLLQRLAGEGRTIEVVAVTDGEAADPDAEEHDRRLLARCRALESETAINRLGIAPIPFTRLGLPDGCVADHEDVLGDALGRIVERRTLCLATWRSDGHPDHDAVGRVAAQVCRRVGAFLVEYLVWAWHWADPTAEDLPWDSCRKWALSDAERARKHFAVEAFRSQVGGAAPVLPAEVLPRFWRPYETFVETQL